MDGLADKALITLPEKSIYEEWATSVQNHFHTGVQKMVEYLKACGMEIYFFNSDELAVYLYQEARVLTEINFYGTFIKEDKLFAKNNVAGLELLPDGDLGTVLEKKARELFPVPRGTSVDERFEIVEKRNKFITKSIIDSSEVVVSFEKLRKEYFKVKTGKEYDERIILRVDPDTLKVTSFMSGSPYDITFLTGHVSTRLSLKYWNIGEIMNASK